MSKLKKHIEECKSQKTTELEFIDRGISELSDYPELFNISHLTRLTLTHNKITGVPAAITNLYDLEILNLFNNHIKELPPTISSMVKLRILNVGMNKMNALPRGFGAFPTLEVLDLTYNNLNENSLPANFFQLDSLRALYLGDNDFESIPPEIGRLKNLQVLVLRENDIVALPKEIGELNRLRELHIQGNRLTVLPPELGNLDLVGSRQAFKGENNPWVTPIADQYQVGVSHVFDYIRTETYKLYPRDGKLRYDELLSEFPGVARHLAAAQDIVKCLYGRHLAADSAPPPKTQDKSKKVSRLG